MRGKPVVLVSGEGYVDADPKKATHLTLNFPGPVGELTLPVMIGGTRKGTPNWTWNGDIDKPTLKPSVKTTKWIGKNSCHDDGGPSRQVICHTWVTDGKVQFLDDTTHELRGQTVNLLDVDA